MVQSVEDPGWLRTVALTLFVNPPWFVVAGTMALGAVLLVLAWKWPNAALDGPAGSFTPIPSVTVPEIDEPEKRDREGRVSLCDIARWRAHLAACSRERPAVRSAAYAEMRPILREHCGERVDEVERRPLLWWLRRSRERDGLADTLLDVLAEWERCVREGRTLTCYPFGEPKKNGVIATSIGTRNNEQLLRVTNRAPRRIRLRAHVTVFNPSRVAGQSSTRSRYDVRWRRTGGATTLILGHHTDEVRLAERVTDSEAGEVRTKLFVFKGPEGEPLVLGPWKLEDGHPGIEVTLRVTGRWPWDPRILKPFYINKFGSLSEA